MFLCVLFIVSIHAALISNIPETVRSDSPKCLKLFVIKIEFIYLELFVIFVFLEIFSLAYLVIIDVVN